MIECLRRRLHIHRHEWRDAFVFDSALSVSIPDGKTTVLGRAVMMQCECGAMKRSPL